MCPPKPPVPSPCIDVCTYRRRGHCAGCSMTRAQKRIFARLKTQEQRSAFVEVIRAQQARLGRYDHWTAPYAEKCRRQALRCQGKA